jgi:hypothetical protein
MSPKTLPKCFITKPDTEEVRETVYKKYAEMIDYADRWDVKLDFSDIANNKVKIHDATYSRARYMTTFFLGLTPKAFKYIDDKDYNASKQEEIYKEAKRCNKTCYSCDHLDFETGETDKYGKQMYKCMSSNSFMTCFVICRSFTPITHKEPASKLGFQYSDYDYGHYCD